LQQSHFGPYRQIARVTVLMLMINVIIWMPWCVVWLIDLFNPGADASKEGRVPTTVIGYIPAAVDPFLVMLTLPILKAEIRKKMQNVL
jgi:hypothetical protein